MDDLNQIEPPPSFVALFTSASGQRLTQPPATIRERYELCEDLAQALAGQASTALFATNGTEREVLERMMLALTAGDSAVGPAEASWVLRRLAELLDWAPL